MKENKDFDFEKHYGDEREIPPASFWDDLEKQIPKKRNKRGVLFWIASVGSVAALLLLTIWGVNHFSKSSNTTASTNKTVTKPNSGRAPKTITLDNENTTSSITNQLEIEEKKEQKITNSPLQSAPKIETKATTITTKKTNSTENPVETDNTPLLVEENTKKNKIPLEQETPATKETKPTTTPENVELPTVEIIGEKWLAQSAPKEDTTKKQKQVKTEVDEKKEHWLINNLYASLAGFAHTHTFNNFNLGGSIGVGTFKQLNKNWQVRFGVNYINISNPGLRRSSVREHYFITKTVTTQQLEITQLEYFTGNAKLDYSYKKWHFYGGIEAQFLFNSKANLRISEVKYSEERVTEKRDVTGYTAGVNTIVPQLTFGVGNDITDDLRVELQFSHSITPYGSQSIFTTNNKLRLSYVGFGVNWRINQILK